MGLSPREKDMLLNRPKNSRDRATNDVRVRKKLAAWLKELPDMKLIFRYLPENQLRKELEDSDTYLFLEFAEKTMACLGFGPIEGDVKTPEEWKVVIHEDNQRLAENSDIIRSLIVSNHLEKLDWLRSPTIGRAIFLSKIDAEPEFRDRVTDEERKGIARVIQAQHEYEKELQKILHKWVDEGAQGERPLPPPL